MDTPWIIVPNGAPHVPVVDVQQRTCRMKEQGRIKPQPAVLHHAPRLCTTE
jgi:hypothetical protein